jgi:hypothetical protein
MKLDLIQITTLEAQLYKSHLMIPISCSYIRHKPSAISRCCKLMYNCDRGDCSFIYCHLKRLLYM